jgi:Ser/Thr protein kinase RdoA (MazF antagonist)
MAAVEHAALSTAAPSLSPLEVRALASELYGIDGSVQPLAGERDQNCRVETADGRRYVLKISNPREQAEIVDFQVAALEHMARAEPHLPVPRVVRTLEGHARRAVALGDGTHAMVRMLTYLDGIQIRETVRTPAQRRSMGKVLARLDRALQGFSHPGAKHDLLWNVSTAHRLAAKIDGIANSHRRALAKLFMARFTDHVLHRLDSLRSQVIHNDYHFYNVLVAADDHERIVGIIDFGDMLHAPLVGEVGTAAAFHMDGNAADPFEGAAQFVAGYHETLPLTGGEQEVVADLMATRHLITALISEWRSARYPDNRPYIMRHNPAAWEALSLMADLSRAQVRDRLLAGIETGVTP